MAAATQKMSQPKDYKLIVEKDVRIPLRDGTVLYADIFRPDGGEERFPVIMNIGPYMKDKLWVPPPDLEEAANPYMNWETANPLWWCPRGYALLRVDTRGSGKSPGKCEPSSHQEAVDCYDCIEWVAKLPWCNGNVGTLGISYHAAFQWRVANLQPPSLKAICPWEGRADQYRDQAYHGGIFALGFIGNWWLTHTAHHLLGRPRSYNPDAFDNNLLWNMMRNDLDSEWWRQCSARWDQIKVPVYSVGNWGGFALHLRGNTEGFMNAASKHKKLRIHTGTHFHPFHSEEGRLEQLRWLDYWLKGLDTGIMEEPPVKLEIRTGGSPKAYPFRFESEWPLARTQWTKLYLDPAQQALSTKPVAQAGKIEYDALGKGVTFRLPPLEHATEITGPMAAKLFVSSSTRDADLFLIVRVFDPAGKELTFMGSTDPNTPIANGWLRASHRALDPKRSQPWRPFHPHDRAEPLTPGEVCECDVEIVTSCIVVPAGWTIALTVRGKDYEYEGELSEFGKKFHYATRGTGGMTHDDPDNRPKDVFGGTVTLHAGGGRDAYLLVPIVST
jgi:uncharacterized protein